MYHLDETVPETCHTIQCDRITFPLKRNKNVLIEKKNMPHYDSKHRKMFRQILKATGNTPIHRILMQMHDIKYIYCHFCRKQGRRLQGQAQGIKMTNNK